jgi:hypothetical protein
MTKPLQSSSIAAPGFFGLNTQESGITLDSGFALQATNCVIDKFGRLGARKGWQFLADTITDGETVTSATGVDLQGMHRFVDIEGTEYFGCWSTDSFYIYSGGTLIPVTYNGSQTINKGNWQAVTLNDAAYLFQSGYEPIYFNPLTEVLTDVSSATNYATVTITHSGTEAIVEHTAHNFVTGQIVTISGADQTEYNGTFTIEVSDVDTYTYTMQSSPGTDATGTITSTWETGAPPQANTALSAYGRVWAASTNSNKTILYWSDLLDGSKWTGGTAGFLDISAILVNGNDEIVSLGAHNGFLIIFCKQNIIILGDADNNQRFLDPITLQLVEVISGVGCVARDSVVNTGTDILFLSESGVRSLGRVIQEKSQPMRDISKNVRDDLVQFLEGEIKENIKAVYSERYAFYLLAFPSTQKVYCFDMRGPLQDGSARVTIWDNMNFTSWLAFDGTVYMTHEDGLAQYFGYQDNNELYRMVYYTNYFDLGDASVSKMLKKLSITIIGATGQGFTVKSGFDYSDLYVPYNLTVRQGIIYEYFSNKEEQLESVKGKYGVTTATVSLTQGSTTITDEDGIHYTVDFSLTKDENQDGYNTDLLVYQDPSDGYYYHQNNTVFNEDGTVQTAGTREPKLLYVKAVDFASEYSGGVLVDTIRVAGSGSGNVMQLGFEADVNGGALSIQKMDVYVKQGRIL